VAAVQRVKSFAWIEFGLGACVLVAGLYTLWFLRTNGYLPQPFFYDTSDTLMDFYHTAYWSHSEGPYSVWQSVYPPLSFALLQLLTPAQCYVEDPFVGRECDGLSWLMLVAATGWLVLLVARLSRDVGVWARLARVTAVCIGLPTLFCLERGNLLMLAAPALLYGLTRPGIDMRASLALAFAINLKPYLVLLVLPVFVKHGWKAAARLLLGCTGVYLASILAVGDGLPWSILDNVRSFTGEGLVNYWEKFYFSTSFSPFIRILESELPIEAYLDGNTAERLAAAMRTVIAVCTVAMAGALLAAWSMPRDERPFALITCTVLAWAMVVTESFGGYAMVLVTALLFTAPARGRLFAASLVLCYLLSLPYDHVVAVVRESEGSIWLSGQEVETRYGVAIGHGLRPAGIALMQLLLSTSIITGCLRHRSIRPPGTALAWHPERPRPATLRPSPSP
jgi:hypothetical protein